MGGCAISQERPLSAAQKLALGTRQAVRGAGELRGQAQAHLFQREEVVSLPPPSLAQETLPHGRTDCPAKRQYQTR